MCVCVCVHAQVYLYGHPSCTYIMYTLNVVPGLQWQELGRLREMQFLELSENRLEILPAEMGNLTELRDCYLSENLLTDLPETFGKESQSHCDLILVQVSMRCI